MISDKHKFIYVHVPKCGGVTMTHQLLPFSDDIVSNVTGKNKSSIMVRRPNNEDHKYFGNKYMHASAEEIKKHLGDEKFDDYYKFTTIRNTYDRLVSLYFWATNDTSLNSNKFKEIISYNGLNGREGVDYKNGIIKQSRGSTPINFFICDGNDELMVDDVFLINDNENAMSEIYKKIGIVDGPSIKPKQNTSNHKHYSSYYTQELIDIVDELYEKEINKFNFKFENKSNKIIKSK